MKAQIFAYKGNLGATTDPENGKFLNNPLDEGQLGCVISTKEATITAEAKELFKKARREGGSFAEIMLTRHNNGSGSSIGLLGLRKHHFGQDFCISRDCDLSVLDDIEVVETEAPEDYRQFIDNKRPPSSC
jgi:hypothetical protein